MVTKSENHIPLSYSRLSDYETCPRKFHAKYISKIYPDESNNPVFAKGNKIHKDLEFIGKSMAADKDMPDVMEPTKTVLSVGKISPEAVNGLPLLANVIKNFDILMFEQQIAVDFDMNRSSWFENSSCYYRIIGDVIALRGHEGLAVDWKSGKVREYDDKPTGQLHLVAGVLMSLNPAIDRITTAYVFVEHKQVIDRTFFRKDVAEILAPFEEKYHEVCNDTEFEPRKNTYCYNCKVPQCEFK